MTTTRGEFLSDIETLRRRAREHIEQGALTRGYQADRAIEGGSLVDMIRGDLVAERVTIDSYRDTLDPTKPGA